MNIDIWSDVVCPWCYVGKRRFESALDKFDHADDVTVTWHSYQLDPQTTSTPEGQDGHFYEHFAAKFGKSVGQVKVDLASMTQTAAAEGLEYHFENAKPANTFDAHRLLHLAAESGLQDQLKELLLLAYFTQGRSVGDSATLLEVAVEAGLDREQVTSVLAGDDFADAVRADQSQARAYGITGVPFFVIDGKYGVSGAQPADSLLQVMQQAWQEEHPLKVMAGSGESCEGDTCAV